MFPKIMHYKEKSLRDLTTTSPRDTQALKRSKNSCYKSIGGKMKKDIKAYIYTCETCQRTKSSMQAKAAPLHPNTIPSQP